MSSGRVGQAFVLKCFFTAGYGRHRKLGVGFRTAGYGRHRSQWVKFIKFSTSCFRLLVESWKKMISASNRKSTLNIVDFA